MLTSARGHMAACAARAEKFAFGVNLPSEYSLKARRYGAAVAEA